MNGEPKDLIILVADKNMEHTIKGLLARPPALGIRPLSFDIRVHPERDAGCRGEAHRSSAKAPSRAAGSGMLDTASEGGWGTEAAMP